MDVNELKKYIIENDKTKEVLEGLGCFNIKTYTKEYRCGSPKHNNSTSISVRRDSLKIKIYGRDNKVRGDIITLAMELKECIFPESVKLIHKILGLKYTKVFKKVEDKPKVDILDIFKRAIKTSHSKKDYYDEELEILNNDITSEYIECPFIEWVKEGILPYTQKIFGIGYSPKANRVIVPHRYCLGDRNDYVGVIGRTLVKNYDMFDIPKYFPIHKYHKSMNVYGLQENYDGIQKAGYCVVYEAEKSTMKRHSKLDYTGVSIFGHELSDEQAKILIGLNVDIIIALDKDITIEKVWETCEKFYRIRNIYYIYDDIGLLGDKESPADKHEKIYKVLFNRRVRYDEEHHQKYINFLNELGKGGR